MVVVVVVVAVVVVVEFVVVLVFTGNVKLSFIEPIYFCLCILAIRGKNHEGSSRYNKMHSVQYFLKFILDLRQFKNRSLSNFFSG